ncbi:hypothetical protein AU193_08460 [Mycobacterium sp. GA-1285]|uniref:DUF4190 domain-containing protein n=1 Tax=Mycobacterium sp. GA-1285 TaxID=1772282 RepID=UPI00074B2648|nr:DUF4190 domain-containing protein [Mycobacterium sp. GA-1285]KUI14053.1 hypothetical protein AU193_08460 [Mycobacterium sp. GA-1285]
MTNPGEDAARNAPSESSGGASEQTSAGYEAPPIEQSQTSPTGQPTTPYGHDSRFERPADQPPTYGTPYQTPPAYDPSSGYPPPPAYAPPPQGAYPPPPPSAYPPPPPGVYPPPYPDPADAGQGYPPPYGAASPYGTPTSYSGYGTPGYAGGYGAPQGKTNGLAIGSLVASAVGVLCGVGSLIGIVLGIVALNQIKTSGDGGRGLAIAGIAVGAATLLLNIIVTVAMLST